MRVEIDIQRAEAIQLIQAVDGQQYEKLEKSLHALLAHASQWDWKDYEKNSIFNVKRGNIQSRLSTTYCLIAYNFDEDPKWKKNVPVSHGLLTQRMSPLEKTIEAQE